VSDGRTLGVTGPLRIDRQRDADGWQCLGPLLVSSKLAHKGQGGLDLAIPEALVEGVSATA